MIIHYFYVNDHKLARRLICDKQFRLEDSEMKFFDKFKRINRSSVECENGIFKITCSTTGFLPKRYVFYSLEKPEETYAGKLMYLPAEYYEPAEELPRTLSYIFKGYASPSQLAYFEELFNNRLANGYEKLQDELFRKGYILEWYDGVFYITTNIVSTKIITVR